MRKIFGRICIASSLAFIAISITSCSHYYYGPNSANVPLLQQKGDGKVMGALATADETTGFELQSAYAFSKHFGAMLNFYTTAGSDKNYLSNSSSAVIEKGSGTLGEIGAGYFTKIKNSESWILETYAGVGKGTVKNEYGATEMSKVDVTRFFIQPSIGYLLDKNFEFGISSRFSHVNFTGIKKDLSPNNTNFAEVLDLANNPTHLFWEPSLLLRAGFENIKFHLQATMSTALKEKKFATQNNVLSLGLSFSFPAKVTSK